MSSGFFIGRKDAPQPEEPQLEQQPQTPEPNMVQENRGGLLANVPKLEAPPKAAPKVQEEPTQGELLRDEVTEDYSRLINYLKKAEGNAKSQAAVGSYKGGRFRIYDDVGAPAIGYGHRLTEDEKARKAYKGGITEDQAHEILMQDIKKAEIGARKHFGDKGWEAMDQHRKEMAIDYVYNLGVGGFSKFKELSKYIRMGNISGIRAKYKRHYSPTPGAVKVPLKARNDLFYKTFILPIETGEIEIKNYPTPKQTAKR